MGAGRGRGRRAAASAVMMALALGPGCAGGGGAADASATSTSGATATDTAEGTSTSAATEGTTTTGGGSLETEGATETATSEGAGCRPALDAIASDVFVPRCGGAECHDSVAPAGGLNLVSSGVEARLVGVPAATCEGWLRVAPGDPEGSLLHAKLVGEAPCGAAMPLGGPPLAASAIACIDGWIAAAVPSCETCGGARCLDLQGDPSHCGGCDTACPADAGCTLGHCVCPGSAIACGDACVDTAADPAHCGGCDQPCLKGQVCAGGACAADCGPLTECEGGCVDIATDPAHCGGCEVACPVGQMCLDGACGLECGELSECGGACVDTEVDPAHCGGCDQACAPGTACQGGGCVCAGPPVPFKATIAPLLESKCALPECHGPPNYEASLDLTAVGAWADLVGVASVQCGAPPRVEPGDPAGSYLMDKLLGVDLCLGVKMPKQAPPLSDAELAAIGGWICQGALDD